MQNAGFELRRISVLGTWVNKDALSSIVKAANGGEVRFRVYFRVGELVAGFGGFLLSLLNLRLFLFLGRVDHGERLPPQEATLLLAGAWFDLPYKALALEVIEVQFPVGTLEASQQVGQLGFLLDDPVVLIKERRLLFGIEGPLVGVLEELGEGQFLAVGVFCALLRPDAVLLCNLGVELKVEAVAELFVVIVAIGGTVVEDLQPRANHGAPQVARLLVELGREVTIPHDLEDGPMRDVHDGVGGELLLGSCYAADFLGHYCLLTGRALMTEP